MLPPSRRACSPRVRACHSRSDSPHRSSNAPRADAALGRSVTCRINSALQTIQASSCIDIQREPMDIAAITPSSSSPPSPSTTCPLNWIADWQSASAARSRASGDWSPGLERARPRLVAARTARGWSGVGAIGAPFLAALFPRQLLRAILSCGRSRSARASNRSASICPSVPLAASSRVVGSWPLSSATILFGDINWKGALTIGRTPTPTRGIARGL